MHLFAAGRPMIYGARVQTRAPHLVGGRHGSQRNTEVASPKAASAASKVLKKPGSSKDAKTAAGSALTQKPNKKK